MKHLNITILLLLLHVPLLLNAQQYVLRSSDDRVYYHVKGEWKPVFHNETILDKKTIVKSDGPFSVIERWNKQSVIDCPSSTNGEALGDLIKEGLKRTVVVRRTSTSKGSTLDFMNIETRNHLLSPSTDFHYLLIGCDHFNDSHWEKLPSPEKNLKELSQAMDNIMIPFNKYNLKSHGTLIGLENTNRETIINKFKNLSDSVRMNSNDMVLIYLSSHGVKDKEGIFHFIASDTQFDSVTNTPIKSISADILNSYINSMAAKGARVLVFVDACYSESLVLNLKKIDGSCVYFMSTENDLIANDDQLIGSPFMRALIKCVSGEEQVYFRDEDDNIITPQNLQDYLFYNVQSENKNQRPVSRRFDFGINQKLWTIKSSASARMDSLQRKARLGNTDAMVELGNIYFDDSLSTMYEVKNDTAKALDYYRYAYEWQNPMAACRLGMYYYYLAPSPKYDDAFKYFLESATKGCNLGKYYLSVCYYKGLGVPANEKQSKSILKTISSLDWDIKQAFLKEEYFFPIKINGETHNLTIVDGRVWERYSTGYDPVRDRINRPELYAADLEFWAEYGKAKYQAATAQMYLYGLYTRDVNYEKALYWYNESSKQGCKEGLYGLGLLYKLGAGVEIDYVKADQFFSQAASKKLSYVYSSWGDLYAKGGYGIEKDERHAVVLWKKAADLNDIDGLYKYAYCLENGISVKEDKKEAFNLFMKCAKKGDSMAQHAVGYLLFNGIGVKKDSRNALKWLTKAKNQGDKNATLLIDEYYYADGTAKDVSDN